MDTKKDLKLLDGPKPTYIYQIKILKEHLIMK